MGSGGVCRTARETARLLCASVGAHTFESGRRFGLGVCVSVCVCVPLQQAAVEEVARLAQCRQRLAYNLRAAVGASRPVAAGAWWVLMAQ